MKNCYRVYYVGDDSLGHSKVTWAKDHELAIAAVTEKTGTDIITGVKRCMDPRMVIGVCVAVMAVLLVLLVKSAIC